MTVVEVGPETVVGSNGARAEWVSAAIDCIEDDIALVDERPVAVEDVWRLVLREVAGDAVETLVLVCPTWWARRRVDVVTDAARGLAMNVVVLDRVSLLRDGNGRPSTVVEVATDLVVVSAPGSDLVVVTRNDDCESTARAVVREIARSSVVLVDIPDGIDDAARIGDAIVRWARSCGIDARVVDRDWVVRTAALRCAGEQGSVADTDDARPSAPSPRRRRVAVLAGVVVSAAAMSGFVIRHDPPAAGVPTTLLVEGRVGVKVPALWSVSRISSGPGSARVQINSPSDGDVALHLTQSVLSSNVTLEMTGEALRVALGDEPVGAFVDFNPQAQRAGKAAVTYREVRSNRRVEWTVLVDGTLRIALGCQSAPGREQLVRDACDQAVASAHAVF